LLADGDELNLILQKSAHPLYFFPHQAFCHFHKYCYMKMINDFAFCFATFSQQDITAPDASLHVNGKK